MKLYLIPGLVILLVSCNTDNTETIRKKIISKKEQITKINKSIKELEDKLQIDSANASFYIPVNTRKIKYEPFRHYIEAQGNIEAVEDAFISPEIGGRINKIHVHEGEKVSKGQFLISLNTDVTESAIKEVKTGLELAKKLFGKQESLWEQKIGSEMQYLEAKNAYEQAEARLKTLQAQLEMSKIRAPFSGIIDKIFQKEGELAAPGYRILQLVNLNKMKIVAEISEIYLPNVIKGKLIDISIPTYPDMKLKVPVHRTGNVVNPANRTFEIEVRINNAYHKLKPNMLAVLKVNDLTIESAIIVPSNIIKKDIIKTKEGEFKEFLFVAEEDSNRIIAKKLYVETGATYNNESVVTGGLTLDMHVIVDGYNTVSTGTEVKILNVVNN